MNFFEENAYGIRSFEMGITTKGEAEVTDLAVLNEMKKIQDFLQTQEKFSPFFSVVTVLEQGNYIYHFNRKNYLRLPDKQEDVNELLTLAGSQTGTILENVVSPDRKMARIHSRMPDVGTDAFQQLSTNLDQYIYTQCDTTLFSHRLTGNAFLTEQNFFYLRRSLLSGLFLAFVVIGVLMGMLFRSWKMMLISMVPNVIPLLLTGGIMGLFGIKLTPSTSIVFVIAFGIAVDDTIHFPDTLSVGAQRREKHRGGHPRYVTGNRKSDYFDIIGIVIGLRVAVGFDLWGNVLIRVCLQP